MSQRDTLPEFDVFFGESHLHRDSIPGLRTLHAGLIGTWELTKIHYLPSPPARPRHSDTVATRIIAKSNNTISFQRGEYNSIGYWTYDLAANKVLIYWISCIDSAMVCSEPFSFSSFRIYKNRLVIRECFGKANAKGKVYDVRNSFRRVED